MKKRLLMILLALLPLAMNAQSPAMMALAQSELQKRGLTEGEVRARLVQRGIDIDAISPSNYASYQGQVIAILDELQAEKSSAAASASTAAAQSASAQAAGPSTLEEVPVTTSSEAAAEREAQVVQATVAQAEEGGSEIYGHSLFSRQALEVFRTTNGAEAPDTYVLDEGDEVHISIFGASQTEIHQRIGSDGSIQPVGANKIFLKGMTLAQARSAIINNMAAHYSFRRDQIAVTITTARTISVNIYGEVGTAGGFTLSALNTAFNALAAAGGPTELGSVRNIQHTRGNKTTTLDLYAFMNKAGDKTGYDLRNNDILYVPTAQKIVRIDGAVKRPMRYEMIEGETLLDLINYAGGLRDDAYPTFVQIERHENGEIKYLEYDLSKIMSGSRKAALSGGDVVRIKTVAKPMENYVSIQGDVYYGGNFDIDENSSLKGLIEKAEPRYTARKDYVFVERTNPDETVEILTVPYPGENGNPDFKLQARDVVRVLELSQFRDVESISVSGQVRRPFSREFGLTTRMTVNQAIEYAGGLKENVFPVAYIVRRDLKNPTRREYIRLELDKDGEMVLQPGDELNVYDNSTYSNIGEIRISGAVKRPFGTPYDGTITLHDLITMAGGFSVGAAYDRVEVFRTNISRTDEKRLELLTIAVDSTYNVTSGDFQIQPYDHVVVRMTPNFTTGRTVELNGRVRYPGAYVIDDNKTTLAEVIERAGGLLDDADPYASVFRTFNNRGNIAVNLDKATSGKYGLNYNPILMDGDVINITRQENIVVIRGVGTRMNQYSPPGYDSSILTITYQGKHGADWYIRKYAGGFQKATDRNSVTVTMPNNQMLGTQKILGIRDYPTVEPGGTITMQIDPRKQEKLEKPKEKVDWDATLAKCLTTLTSAVSMIAIITRL